jgi:hypothetical protein
MFYRNHPKPTIRLWISATLLLMLVTVWGCDNSNDVTLQPTDDVVGAELGEMKSFADTTAQGRYLFGLTEAQILDTVKFYNDEFDAQQVLSSMRAPFDSTKVGSLGEKMGPDEAYQLVESIWQMALRRVPSEEITGFLEKQVGEAANSPYPSDIPADLSSDRILAVPAAPPPGVICPIVTAIDAAGNYQITVSACVSPFTFLGFSLMRAKVGMYVSELTGAIPPPLYAADDLTVAGAFTVKRSNGTVHTQTQYRNANNRTSVSRAMYFFHAPGSAYQLKWKGAAIDVNFASAPNPPPPLPANSIWTDGPTINYP